MSLKARMTYINVNKCNLSFLSLYVGLNPQHSESKDFSFYFLMICEIKQIRSVLGHVIQYVFFSKICSACALKIEINNYISAITAEEVSNYKRWLAVKTLALI